MSALEEAIEMLKQEGFSSEQIQRMLTNLKNEAMNNSTITGSLDDYLDDLAISEKYKEDIERVSQGKSKSYEVENVLGFFDKASDNGEFILDIESAREERTKQILSKNVTK